MVRQPELTNGLPFDLLPFAGSLRAFDLTRSPWGSLQLAQRAKLTMSNGLP